MRSLWAFGLQPPENEPKRLRLPAPISMSHFDECLGILSFATVPDATHREIAIWDLTANNSRTFNLPVGGDDHCKYCSVPNGATTHGLLGVWINAHYEKILFIFGCLRKDSPCLYVRLVQTDLTGVVLFDEHLQIAYVYCEVPEYDLESRYHHAGDPHGAAHQCNISSQGGSSIINISLGYDACNIKYLGASISFDIDTAETPPLQINTAEIWLATHPLSSHVTRRIPYRGKVYGQHYEPAPDEGEGKRSQVECHTFANDDLDQQMREFEGCEIGHPLEMIYRSRSDEDGQPLDTRTWKQTSASRSDQLFCYAIAGDSQKINYKTTNLCVYTIDRRLTNATPEALKFGSIFCYVAGRESSWPNGANQRARVIRTLMSDSFVVVQFMMEEGVDNSREDMGMHFIVLAFDPDYYIPSLDIDCPFYFAIREREPNGFITWGGGDSEDESDVDSD